MEFKAVIKKGVREKGGVKIRTAIASTLALDRDLEVLVPEGVLLDNFMENPVMLGIHNYWDFPVGKVLDVKVFPTEVVFDFTFADTEDGKTLDYMYDHEFMRAFSVGFIPKSRIEVDEKSPDKIAVKTLSGKGIEVDLTKYESRPRRIVVDWELLEISPVPVPSNPEALIRSKMAEKGVVPSPVLSGFYKSTQEGIEALVNDAIVNMGQIEKGVIPFISNEVKTGAFDPELEVDRLLSKFSKADSLNWEDIGFAYAAVDLTATKVKSSYKYMHHFTKDGKVFVSKEAVDGHIESIKELLEADADSEILKGSLDHLNRHVLEFVEPETSEEEGSGDDAGQVETSEALSALDGKLEGLTTLMKAVDESLSVLRVRVQYLSEMGEKDISVQDLGYTDEDLGGILSMLKNSG